MTHSGVAEASGTLSTVNQNRTDRYRTMTLSILYYGAVALCTLVAFVSVMHLGSMDLRVPFNFSGDGLLTATIVKHVAANGLALKETALGAPFELYLPDTGFLFTLDFVLIKAISIIVTPPGEILNLYWVLCVVLSSLSAACCLRRISVTPGIAFVCGVLYGFLPWTFWRNTAHVWLTMYLIPWIVLAIVELLRPQPQEEKHGQLRRLYAPFGACFLAGLTHAYIPFMAGALLGTCSCFLALGRQWRALRLTVLALCLLSLGAAINLLPMVLRMGQPGTHDPYKTATEADIYGLKLRQLVMPAAETPIPFLRKINQRIVNANFPLENENRSTQLGTTGAIGLLLLLGGVVWSLVAVRPLPPPWNGLAFVAVISILIATTGGFGSLFALFVSPMIRAYDRFGMFIGFAALAATALGLSRVSAFHTIRWPWRLVFLGVWLTFGIFDQSLTSSLRAQRRVDESLYWRDDRFVERVEAAVPPGSMVFQLPHTEFIHDQPPAQMGLYDHARAFLHAKTLRFSWGALTGQHGDWAAATSHLPVDIMLRRLKEAGFAGIWLDRNGYSDNGVQIVQDLAQHVPDPPITSEDGRYSFYTLRSLPQPAISQSARTEALNPVTLEWADGFYDQERDQRQYWRWSRRSSSLVFVNPLPEPRSVQFRVELKAFDVTPKSLTVTGGEPAMFPVSIDQKPYVLTVKLGPNERKTIHFSYSGPASAIPGDPREMSVMFIDYYVVPDDTLCAPSQLPPSPNLQMSDSVRLKWGNGFYGDERDPRQYWRWSQRSSSLTFVNSLPIARSVQFRVELKAWDAKPKPLSVTGAEPRTLLVSTDQKEYILTIKLAPYEHKTVHFNHSGTVPAVDGDPRQLSVMFINYRLLE